MKSVIAVAICFAAMMALQGCGGGSTTTVPPGPTSSAAPSSSLAPMPTSTSAPCPYNSQILWECPTTLAKTSFADMHDGDAKDVELANGVLTISDPNGAWQTQLNLDSTTCSGQVDFNVPGKLNPP